ncbi:ABC transporter permease [Azospirillum sp. YIM B02556]|uniref:ABC transporter permease n=1 Tax=Azospirillum endophyticum TaxID=2800326 RepID=A0ABS1FFB9_9PROT|nr:ABC transporter permease [Azospirillum endophyticum]MBK1842100.1 ABC transporter permease [Azospirillum endophyticum]
MLDDHTSAVVHEPSHRLMSLATPQALVKPALLVLFLALIGYYGEWNWIADYWRLLLHGIAVTLALLVSSSIIGFVLALLLGVFQVTGPRTLAWPAQAFCTIIRGTPLLLQLWMLYFGLGAVFAQYPEIRSSFVWPYLREAWPYALAALVFSFAGYVGEVMRGAFAGVPKGELEAARAFGMSRRKMFLRIWLPRAVQRVLPVLTGEVILQLKSTPLVATVTMTDVFAVVAKVRQDTYLTYEPLILLALIYVVLTAILARLLRLCEARVTGN